VVLVIVALLIFAVPFLIILSSAFDGAASSMAVKLWPSEPSLENVREAERLGVFTYLLNSFVIVGGGLVLQIVIAVLSSYALARHRFRGLGVVMALFLLTMMLPEEIIAIPLAQTIGDVAGTGLNLRGTPFGVILPVAVWGFSIFVMTEFMRDLPAEIEEAARLDGVGELRMLWSIILPMCKPVLGVVTIFGFMMIWDQYLLPLIAANSPDDYTLTVALRVLRAVPGSGSGVILFGALLALVPSLIIYLLMQKSLIRGIAAGATKG
jgi:multiple sugar transport system permease protein